MSLSIGIVGLPNVGKSTLFNALTSNAALAANYPFATIEPNVGIVGVPDVRLDEIGALYPEAPKVPAAVKFTDIAGLVAGASKGEGLGNQFLSNIRETAAIAHVVRAFSDSNVTHVDRLVDPARDIETINTELVLADLASVTKRIENIGKAAKTDPNMRRDLEYLTQLQQSLDNNELSIKFVQRNNLDEAKISHDSKILISQLLTNKPIIYVFNVDESTIRDEQKKQQLAELISPHACVFISAQIEAELRSLPEDERAEFLADLGQDTSSLEQLVRQGYSTLGLQSFFTAGDKEVKAWTIPVGATAPEAAGVIHGDFERGFIAAEIVNYHDLIASGSRSAAKAAGLVRTEGREYIIQDGDVVEFRFNV